MGLAVLCDYCALLKPPKMLKSAKNIEIGSIEITVQAMDFALSHAVFPSEEV